MPGLIAGRKQALQANSAKEAQHHHMRGAFQEQLYLNDTQYQVLKHMYLILWTELIHFHVASLRAQRVLHFTSGTELGASVMTT